MHAPFPENPARRLKDCGFPACERWQGCLMGRFSNAELTSFRNTSRCSACVHYSGCQLWLALLLMNEEVSHPGLDILVPDITKACPMFFPWSAESARRAGTGSAEASLRPHRSRNPIPRPQSHCVTSKGSSDSSSRSCDPHPRILQNLPIEGGELTRVSIGDAHQAKRIRSVARPIMFGA